jgi:hypothetical protein
MQKGEGEGTDTPTEKTFSSTTFWAGLVYYFRAKGPSSIGRDQSKT